MQIEIGDIIHYRHNGDKYQVIYIHSNNKADLKLIECFGNRSYNVGEIYKHIQIFEESKLIEIIRTSKKSRFELLLETI